VDGGSSGISVIEIPARGQSIPVSRESVTAFIGPAPRGPVDIPVAIRNLEEFLSRFGVPGYLSRMEFLLYQYFENGGTLALVVRVCSSARRNLITLPGPAGELVLEAINPGPLEHLRASIDYQGLDAGERHRFNLVIHRCRSPEHPLVEEQESYPAVSVRPADPDFIGNALSRSSLIRLTGTVPAERPTRTVGADAGFAVRYVYSHGTGRDDSAPTDYDLIGSPQDSSGLFALEQVPWLDFICLVPGISGVPLGPVAIFAAERYCRERHALLLLDPPPGWTSPQAVVGAQRQRGFTSPNVVTYFPALESPPHIGPVGTLSAAGAIAGALCAGGLELSGPRPLSLGRSRPAVPLADYEIHQLARLGVNTLSRSAPPRVELAGLVTMARSSGVLASWNDLRRRRIALFMLSSVAMYTRWAAFEAPAAGLWREVQAQVSEFMTAMHRRGLLAGPSPREAFYVKCDTDTHGTEPSGLVLVVGFALARPGDFTAFRIAHTVAGSETGEVGWQPGLALAG
jgi:hypothetical protein